MARGVWRRSGEAFSAYCGRQIAAHQEEIERCDTLAKQRAQDGYFGAMQFYSQQATIERASCMKWRREMRAALITEGQADKNSDDPNTRREARMKLQTANSSYGKFAMESIIRAPHMHVQSIGRGLREETKYKTVRAETIDGRAFDIPTYPLEPLETMSFKPLTDDLKRLEDEIRQLMAGC